MEYARHIHVYDDGAERFILRSFVKGALRMPVRRGVLVSVVSAVLLVAGAIAGHAQSAPASAPKQRNGTHVYLLRGFMNVFSYGLDELADKLQRRGLQATLHSYTDGPELASTAIQDYKSGRARTVIIIGHSMGAGAAVEMAEELAHANVPVALVVTFDGAGGRTVPPNVKRLVNLYAANGMGAALNPPQGYRGALINWQSKDPDMGHVGVAASPQLHQRVIGYVMSAVGGQSAQAKSDAAMKRDAPAPLTGEGAEH